VRRAGALLVVAAALLGTAAPAHADTGGAPVGVLVRHDDGTHARAIRIADLYPTATRQVVFLLDGDAPAGVRRMRLAVEGLVDREHGCLDPEVREGDSSCGDGEGELSRHVEVALTAGRRDGDACTAAGAPVGTTLRAMADTPAVVGLPAGDDVLCVIADLRHAEGTGDDVTQSDSVQFDLRMEFDAVPLAAGAGPSGAVTVSPAGFASGPTLDLGPEPPAVSFGVPMVLAGVLCGAGAVLLLTAFRRGVAL
jgi:hypothetical protein